MDDEEGIGDLPLINHETVDGINELHEKCFILHGKFCR